jgi:hypothetical protein
MSETKTKKPKTPKTKKEKKEPKTKKEKKEPKTKKEKKEPNPLLKKVEQNSASKTKKEKKEPKTKTKKKPIIILSTTSTPLKKNESKVPSETLVPSETPVPWEMTTISDKIQLSHSPLSQALTPHSEKALAPHSEKALAPPFLKVISEAEEKDLKKSSQHKPTSTMRYNEAFINLLDQLAAIQTKQVEHFRARAYQKAQETIMSYPCNITSPEDLKGKPNIGATIMEKLNEYVETGSLKIIEREK